LGRALWVLFLILILLPPLLLMRQAGGFEIPYSEFKALLRDRAVEEVELRGDVAEGRLREARPLGPQGEEGDRFRTRVPALGDDSLLPTIEETGVRLRVGEPDGGWRMLLLAVAPWLLLMAFFFWFMHRTSRNMAGGLGGRGDLQQFLRGSLQETEISKVTFADVAGQENAKREVEELVDFLRNPAKYQALGAEVPRGVLLMGPPGTGKTLLARALSGEANVPFFAISGSEFIEVFVGVGASRVRSLFEAAKKNAPSIIFIDELDSVGRTRGTGLGGGHDEREQTLNQILAGMDGFEQHEAVIVLAATNRPDVLDPALLRPGRFDRHVLLDLPDRKDRLKILEVHLRRVPLDLSVNLDEIAAGTPGFSGADLKNLINEAALLAARNGAKTVSTQHLEEARDKLLLGTERALTIPPEEKHRLAVHESGHTLIACFLPHADPLYKVTIIPRGRTLGGTQQLPETERHTLPEEYLRDRLAVILGGRTAERELLGSVSSGADDDIREATRLARAMVARWGMSPEVGPVDLRESEEHPFLGREMAQPRHFSESSAQAVDDAVRKLVLEAEKTAVEVIQHHRGELDELVTRLEKEETLHRDEIQSCLEFQGEKTTLLPRSSP
jgi:cell division protease FtsH